MTLFIADGQFFQSWQEVKRYADSRNLMPKSMKTIYTNRGVRYQVILCNP